MPYLVVVRNGEIYTTSIGQRQMADTYTSGLERIALNIRRQTRRRDDARELQMEGPLVTRKMREHEE